LSAFPVLRQREDLQFRELHCDRQVHLGPREMPLHARTWGGPSTSAPTPPASPLSRESSTFKFLSEAQKSECDLLN
jgi:hypothetical protein